MFIESSWQDTVIALLTAINGLLGYPYHTVPMAPLTVDDVVKIAASLQTSAYQPAQWFGNPGTDPIQRGIPVATPGIDPSAHYELVWLAVEPSRPAVVSSRGGGILFEDPFYAILAGFNLGRFKQNWVEVRISGRDKAWSQRSLIVNEITRGTYRPEHYFSLAGQALAEAGELSVGARSILGKDLLRLEFNGRTEVRLDPGGGQLFLLYRYEAP